MTEEQLAEIRQRIQEMAKEGQINERIRDRGS